MAKNYTEEEFNQKASDYLVTQGKNILNSIGLYGDRNKKQEKIQPWFGEGGVLSSLKDPKNQDVNNAPVVMDKQKIEKPSNEMILNIPGNNGLETIEKNIKMNPDKATVITSLPELKNEAKSIDQNFKSVLANGITYEGDLQGNRKFTMGTPGQDGYGLIAVKPETTNNQSLQTIPQGNQKTAKVGGMTITGSQEDINNFSSPINKVDYNSPQYKQWEAQNKLKAEPFHGGLGYSSTISDMPLASQAVAAPVGGWQTRLAVYKEKMDAANETNKNMQSANLANIAERRSERNALAQANQWKIENDFNNRKTDSAIKLTDIQTQAGQLALRQEQNLQEAKDSFIKNPSPENKARLNTLLYDPKKVQQADTKVIDKFDPITNQKIGQTVVRDDGTGNYVDAMKPEEKKEHPAIAYLRANNTPENRAIFIKKYKKLPEGF